MITKSAVATQKRDYLLRTNGGIYLPAAGAIYWIVLGIAGFYLRARQWNLLAFFYQRIGFPLGLLLQKTTESQ